MVNISKGKIDEKILLRLYQLFFKVIYKAHSLDSFTSLIDDLFSYKEKIMFAKRIGIFYLLIKDIDQASISKVLKVSSSTVAKYALILQYKQTLISKLINNLLVKERGLGFLEDVLAEVFIQPGVKIRHHKLKWKYEKSKKRRKILNE